MTQEVHGDGEYQVLLWKSNNIFAGAGCGVTSSASAYKIIRVPASSVLGSDISDTPGILIVQQLRMPSQSK